MTGWLAYLPSPPDSAIDLGPLSLRAYGLAIAIGVIAAVAIAQRRWERAGGDVGDISALALWAVPAGVVGARAYHVLTDLDGFDGRWHEALYIWKGGLGIPGGLLAGVLVGTVVAQARNLRVAPLLDAVAPAIPVAQAIGRLGNWFNQELYGRPTKLPWGLRIDPDHRPDRFANTETFHPTFAYEALWNLALAAALIAIGRRFRLRSGTLFALYVAGYGAGRAWVESLRVDPAAMVGGVRFNVLVGALALVSGGIAAALLARRGTGTAAGSIDSSPSDRLPNIPPRGTVVIYPMGVYDIRANRRKRMTTSTYTVEGMTCGHCVASVTEEVKKIGGVNDVQIDLESGAVTVTSDADLDPATVKAAVEEAGYELRS